MPANMAYRNQLQFQNSVYVLEMRELFNNLAITDGQVAQIVGEIFVAARNSQRGSKTANIAGRLVDYVCDAYLTAGERALVTTGNLTDKGGITA